MKKSTDSIESLENDYWENLDPYPSELVKNVHYIRKKKLSQLNEQDIRLMISQGFSLEHIIPLATQLLTKNLLIECEYYSGDLLSEVLELPETFWSKNSSLKQEMGIILINAEKKVSDSLVIDEDIRDEIKQKLIPWIANQ